MIFLLKKNNATATLLILDVSIKPSLFCHVLLKHDNMRNLYQQF